MNKILKKLNESYPDSSSLRSFFWESLAVGTFIFVFLYFFRPFGMRQMKEDPWLYCLTFGLITFVISLSFEFFLRFVLRIRKDMPSWTLGKWMLSVLVLISLIAIGNYFYLLTILGQESFRLGGLLFAFISTISVGIFPIIFAGLYNQVRSLRKNLKQAEEIELRPEAGVREPVLISLSTSNKGPVFQVGLENLLYLEAMQNYVRVFWIEQDEIKQEIIRSTLSQLEKELPPPYFYRCHRSFIVNLTQIASVEGNAQGLKLSLKSGASSFVPVSRKKIPELKRRLSQELAIRP